MGRRLATVFKQRKCLPYEVEKACNRQSFGATQLVKTNEGGADRGEASAGGNDGAESTLVSRLRWIDGRA
jgi:hypothetical protein